MILLKEDEFYTIWFLNMKTNSMIGKQISHNNHNKFRYKDRQLNDIRRNVWEKHYYL